MFENNRNALARQQMVLAAKGFYSGKIDGIWSAKCIQAKRDFEYSGKFHPCIPNGGLPFNPDKPLPLGMLVDATERSYRALTCSEFETDRKTLESSKQLAPEPQASDDVEVESLGDIVLTSEHDLNAPAFESAPTSVDVSQPYEPGLPENPSPLEAFEAKSVVAKDSSVEDSAGETEAAEPTVTRLDNQNDSSKSNEHYQRKKRKHRQSRPD